MVLLSNYLDWYVKCIRCDACREFTSEKRIGRAKGFVCNNNIYVQNISEGPYPIRPQAGYIDKEWFDHDGKTIRILLLGQNPRGGYKEKDPLLYKMYDETCNASDPPNLLEKKMADIKEHFMEYNPPGLIKHIKETIDKRLKNSKVAFAYANQILCRTEPEAKGIYKMAVFQNVYSLCFVYNIKVLIRDIAPKLIIALGITWDVQFSKHFSDQENMKVTIAHHPSHGWKCQSENKIGAFINENLAWLEKPSAKI